MTQWTQFVRDFRGELEPHLEWYYRRFIKHMEHRAMEFDIPEEERDITFKQFIRQLQNEEAYSYRRNIVQLIVEDYNDLPEGQLTGGQTMDTQVTQEERVALLFFDPLATPEDYVNKMKKQHVFIQSGVWRDITIEYGRKYVKVVSILSNGQRSAIEFIDPQTGSIYKAKNWKQRGRYVGNLGNPALIV